MQGKLDATKLIQQPVHQQLMSSIRQSSKSLAVSLQLNYLSTLLTDRKSKVTCIQGHAVAQLK